MNIREAYNSWSETYDPAENLTRDLDQTATRDVLAKLRFNVTLEIGCGTGKNTELLSQISQSVHCIDFSVGMIKKARQKLGSGNVTFTIADISKKWPYSDHSVDFITCNLVLEHIENLSFIFSEAYRVLTGNGSFLVSEYHPFRQYQGKKAHFEQNGRTFDITAFVHNMSDFIDAGKQNGFMLLEMKEWWHQQERYGPPRIVSFMFRRWS